MKYFALALTICAVLSGVTGCGSDRNVLHVYTWADYVKPELVQRFEAENNCRVVIDTFDSNEAMYAKIKGGATGYDLLFPSSYMVQIMNDQEMLRPLDHTLLPNLTNIDPSHLAKAPDPQMLCSVPYMITYTGLGYLDGQVPDFKASWTMFERADLKGRMTLLNDMREVIGAGLKSLGYSLNSVNEQELEAAKQVVIGWKRNIAKFENEQYKTGLASGEFYLVQGYSGDIVQVMEENDAIRFAIPAEGTSISCDDMVIPQSAPNPALAHAFVNFMHDPGVAAENTEYIGYLCPNQAAYPLMSEEIRNNPAIFVDPAVQAQSEFIGDIGDGLALYTRIWDEIKAAE